MPKIRTQVCGGTPPRDSIPAGEVSLQPSQKTRDQRLAVAMSLMRDALVLLDQSNDADSSSVHLHLAIERLRDVTGESSRFDTAAALQDLD